MNVLPAWMCVRHLPAECAQRPEEDVRHPRTGATDNCESPCVYWERNPSPLEE